MTVCKSAVVLHCINLQFCYVIFYVISMAFDRCSINDYLLSYLLKEEYFMYYRIRASCCTRRGTSKSRLLRIYCNKPVVKQKIYRFLPQQQTQDRITRRCRSALSR